MFVPHRTKEERESAQEFIRTTDSLGSLSDRSSPNTYDPTIGVKQGPSTGSSDAKGDSRTLFGFGNRDVGPVSSMFCLQLSLDFMIIF